MTSSNYIYRFSEVLPHQYGYNFGPIRCEIGNWNFNFSYFNPAGTGFGATEEQARLFAEQEMALGESMNEENMMLGHFNS